ncbi:alpha/beta hydrolase [Streptomyces sp. NPDC002671]
MSTIIHGTWGWKGNWWYPGQGGFHNFILTNHRPNLYPGGAAFAWSGAYQAGHRRRAAVRFHDWAGELASGGLQTVFGHSYGGEVAARAVLAGTSVDQLVLLSSPATHQVEAAATTGLQVVDVRLPFDPVLGLARTRQRMTTRPNVTPVLLSKWRLDHGATHKERVWRKENVAQRGGI